MLQEAEGSTKPEPGGCLTQTAVLQSHLVLTGVSTSSLPGQILALHTPAPLSVHFSLHDMGIKIEIKYEPRLQGLLVRFGAQAT